MTRLTAPRGPERLRGRAGLVRRPVLGGRHESDRTRDPIGHRDAVRDHATGPRSSSPPTSTPRLPTGGRSMRPSPEPGASIYADRQRPGVGDAGPLHAGPGRPPVRRGSPRLPFRGHRPMPCSRRPPTSVSASPSIRKISPCHCRHPVSRHAAAPRREAAAATGRPASQPARGCPRPRAYQGRRAKTAAPDRRPPWGLIGLCDRSPSRQVVCSRLFVIRMAVDRRMAAVNGRRHGAHLGPGTSSECHVDHVHSMPCHCRRLHVRARAWSDVCSGTLAGATAMLCVRSSSMSDAPAWRSRVTRCAIAWSARPERSCGASSRWRPTRRSTLRWQTATLWLAAHRPRGSSNVVVS